MFPEPQQIEKGNIIAADYGAGHALVMIHGVGSDSRCWDKLTPLLTPHFRVFTIELPGVSLLRLSEESRTLTRLASELDEALAERRIERYTLVGHSYGAAVALMCSFAFPETVCALSLLAPGGFGPEINPVLRLMTSRTGGVLLRLAQSKRVRKRVEKASSRYHDARNENRSLEALIDTYDRLSSRNAQLQFRRSIASVFETRRSFGAAEIPKPSVPVQIIWGQDDLVLPVWQSDNACRQLRATSVHILAGAGHSPHTSHAAEVSGFISDFARSTHGAS